MLIEFERVDHIHIYVPDRNKAEIWYRDVLGMERIKEFERWATDNGPLTIANGDVHLALFNGAKRNESTVAIKVSKTNFDAMQMHLNQHGVDFSLEDHELSLSVYFSDPDGNEYEVTTYEVDV